MKQTKSKRPDNQGGPVVTHLSDTEIVLTYPDGSVTRATKDRAVCEKDGLWLLEMVSTLAPQFEAKVKSKKDENDVAA
jgi:hypothetical protein